MIRKSTNLLLTRTLSGCLTSLIKKPNLSLLQVRHCLSAKSIVVNVVEFDIVKSLPILQVTQIYDTKTNS